MKKLQATREQKLKILDEAIYIIRNHPFGMCLSLHDAIFEVLGESIFRYRKLFPKFNQFSYLLKNPCWRVVKEFITASAYWDTFDWYNDMEGTVKAKERRIKFLQYLKTTV